MRRRTPRWWLIGLALGGLMLVGCQVVQVSDPEAGPKVATMAASMVETPSGSGSAIPSVASESESSAEAPQQKGASTTVVDDQTSAPDSRRPAELPRRDPELEDGLQIAAPGVPGAPSDVHVNLFCAPTSDGLTMTVQWVAGTVDAEHEVDISPFANDFYPGTYERLGDLPLGANTITREGLAQGVLYRVRVRVRTTKAWLPSMTIVTEPMRCSHGDEVRPAQP